MPTISTKGFPFALVWFQSLCVTLATFAPSSSVPTRFPSILPSLSPTVLPSTLSSLAPTLSTLSPTISTFSPTSAPTSMPTLQCPHAVVGCREHVAILTTLASCETTLVQVRGRPFEGRGLSIASCDNPTEQQCVSLLHACPCHCLNATHTDTTTPPQSTTPNSSTTVEVKCNDLTGCASKVDDCATGYGQALNNNGRTAVILCDHDVSSKCSPLPELCPCTCGFPSINRTTPSAHCSGDVAGCRVAANRSICDNNESLFNVTNIGFGRDIFTPCNATVPEDQGGDFECKPFNDICRCACIEVTQAPTTTAPVAGATTRVTSTTFDSSRCESINRILEEQSRKTWCLAEPHCLFTTTNQCVESISNETQPTLSPFGGCITNGCVGEDICLDNYECYSIIEQLDKYMDVVKDWPKVFAGFQAKNMNASVVAVLRCVVDTCATNLTNELEAFLRPSISPTLAPTTHTDTTSSTTSRTTITSTTMPITTSITSLSSVKSSSSSLNAITMSAIIVSVVVFVIFIGTAIILYRQRQRYVNSAFSRYEQVSTDLARNDMFVLNATSVSPHTSNTNTKNNSYESNDSYDDAC
eukprot:m.157225 g.157225  ORF g.157225 m.157225 type:complete len:585 (-) comp31043_c0_seq1:1255-3009(-)